MKKPDIIGHRGAAGHCPENTMAAFKEAIKMGANGIETDVQMTADGHLILIHDHTLDRTTNGHGFVRDHSLKELKALDAGSWFDESFASETIPTLDELFDLVKDTDVELNIELKNIFEPYVGMEQKIIDLMIQYNMMDKVIISCFKHESLVLCKNINDNVATGILYTDLLYEPWNYGKLLKANALHPAKNRVNQHLVQQAHKAGIKVNVWTVNDSEHMAEFVRYGVDGIITDFPDRLQSLLSY